MNSRNIKSKSKIPPYIKVILFIVPVTLLYYYVIIFFEKDELANKIAIIAALTAILSLFKDMIISSIFCPVLQLKLILFEPDCLMTQFTDGEKVYYFRLRVCNLGLRSAEEVEVVLEKVEIFEDGQYKYSGDYMPLPLMWSHWRKQVENTNIPSGTFRHCDLGFILEPSNNIINIDSGPVYSHQNNKLLFWFDTRLRPNAGSTYLLPGKYKIEISAFGKNIQRETLRFIVDWKGAWEKELKVLIPKSLSFSKIR